MGMQKIIHFPAAPPAWTKARDLLAAQGRALQIRMIDGQLAFPDEEPSELWRELRLSTPQGMITVQREANRLALVVWGNADEGLRQQWNVLASAFAEAGGGTVETAEV